MPRRGLTPATVAAAAVAVADADGLPAVTLARVAADLGVRAPSLYNHVAGRDELLRAVAVRALSELADAMTDAAVGRAGADALLAAGHAYRRYAHAHPGRAAATMRVPGDDATLVQARRAEWVLVAGLREWALDETAAIHAVRALRAFVVGFVALEAADGFGLGVDVDASFDAGLRALLDGLRARLA